MEMFFKSEFYKKLCSVYSQERMAENIETLYKLEKPRGYSTFCDSTLWCEETLKKAGFSDVKRSENGLLYLTKAANMYMSAKVTEHFDLGSHTLFIAELTDGVVLSDAESCTYGYYQSDIKPKPQAPASKKSWTCSVCGYVYEGDEVPDDFECPLCHHGKEDFVLN